MKSSPAKKATPPSVFDPTCPARDALELIANKWALLILTALEAGAMRNGDLMRKIGGVSQKMLTQTLKELERNGLVVRRDMNTVPPHVEYSLSPLGASLGNALIVLDRWAEDHCMELDAARERADLRRARAAFRIR